MERLGLPGSSLLAWAKTESHDARRCSVMTPPSSRSLTALAWTPFTKKRSFGRDRDRHIITPLWQRLFQRALTRQREHSNTNNKPIWGLLLLWQEFVVPVPPEFCASHRTKLKLPEMDHIKRTQSPQELQRLQTDEKGVLPGDKAIYFQRSFEGRDYRAHRASCWKTRVSAAIRLDIQRCLPDDLI